MFFVWVKVKRCSFLFLLFFFKQACHGCAGSKCDCSGVKGEKVNTVSHTDTRGVTSNHRVVNVRTPHTASGCTLNTPVQLMNICVIHSDLKFVTESINSSEESLLRAQSQGAKARLLIDFLHIIKSNTYLKKKTRTQETVFLGITNEIFFFFFYYYSITRQVAVLQWSLYVSWTSQTYHRLKHYSQNNRHGSLNNK